MAKTSTPNWGFPQWSEDSDPPIQRTELDGAFATIDFNLRSDEDVLTLIGGRTRAAVVVTSVLGVGTWVFPEPFTGSPVVVATPVDAVGSPVWVEIVTLSPVQVSIQTTRLAAGGGTEPAPSVSVHLMAREAG